ncbi:hypothetical protein EAF04_004565 [Stromatinia cepivora]|nr:hypothetical protein EAF04_004565 [Stromatinia cepivora]
MANSPTWTYSPTLKQPHDLVVTHGLSQVHGNMTGGDLNQIVRLIHQRIILIEDMTFIMGHPQYLFPGVGPAQKLRDEQYAARRVALLQAANAPAPARIEQGARRHLRMRQIIRTFKSLNILRSPALIRQVVRKIEEYDDERDQALVIENSVAIEAHRRGTCYANLAVGAADARIATEQQRDHALSRIQCLEAKLRQQATDA